MTDVDAAIAAVRARWQHAPLDAHDVLERVAVRLDGAAEHYSVLAHQGAVRLFRKLPSGVSTSVYVHALAGVDAAIDTLEQRARAS